MEVLSVATYFDEVLEVLGRSPLFHGLAEDSLVALAERAELLRFDPDEPLARQGDAADAFLLLVEGGATVVRDGGEGESLDGGPPLVLARISPPESIGEMGVLLRQPRTASVYADGGAIVLRYGAKAFHEMLLQHPYFGLVMSRTLAERLRAANRRIPLPELGDVVAEPEPDARALLPVDFQIRHRIVPLTVDDLRVRVGCVDDADPEVIDRIRRQLPGLRIRPVRITAEYFERAMRAVGGAWFDGDSTPPEETTLDRLLELGESRLELLLKRMVAEGASELHLAAGRIPRWRIDGDLLPLSDSRRLGVEEAFEWVLDLMARPNLLAGFDDAHTFELTHEIADVARFRIRLTRDVRGVGATIRSIPLRVPSAAQLGLPPALVALTARQRGLILVAGPRGSGRTTSIAALVGRINRERPVYVLTLEDPITFLHESDAALVVQREVGRHTDGLAPALVDITRDEPDVVVIGDLTADGAEGALALASTGPLVIAGLAAESAVDAVERLLAMFGPADRAAGARTLSRCLLGVSAQVLAQRRSGGRLAAFEYVVVEPRLVEDIAAQRSSGLAGAREQTLAQVLAARVEAGALAVADARRAAPDPTSFDQALAALRRADPPDETPQPETAS